MMKLNKHQADAARWALDSMHEYWDPDCGEGYADIMSDGPLWPEPTDWHLPEVRGIGVMGGTLILSNWHEVNDDLAYRIGTQYASMIHTEADNLSRHVKRRMTQAVSELETYIRARMTAPQGGADNGYDGG